jgi:hypothetical protein
VCEDTEDEHQVKLVAIPANFATEREEAEPDFFQTPGQPKLRVVDFMIIDGFK